MLDVDSVNMIVMSKSFARECTNVERWYKTKYAVEGEYRPVNCCCLTLCRVC